MRETALVTHHASRIRGYQPPEFLKNLSYLIFVAVQVSLARPQGFNTQEIQILNGKPLGSIVLARPQGFDTQEIQILNGGPLASVA